VVAQLERGLPARNSGGPCGLEARAPEDVEPNAGNHKGCLYKSRWEKRRRARARARAIYRQA